MNVKFDKSCHRRPRSALTLIEVVAGLSLLSMVLIASLLAMRRHEQQYQLAAAKLHATDVADQLLADLMRTQGFLPIAQQGQITDQEGLLLWHTEPLPLEGLGLPKVRLSLRRPGDRQALVAIEVLATPPATPQVHSP